MIDNYKIVTGIDKSQLAQLSKYVSDVESTNPSKCYNLNDIIDNNPKVLIGQPISSTTNFPFLDLAFIYKDDQLFGHLITIINKESIEFGQKIRINILENYSYEYIPNNYFDKYMMSRLDGKRELRFNINEKTNQK